MGHPEHTAEEIADRGREIYERDIRSEVEAEHTGEFLVIDVTTGDYNLSADEAEAFDLAGERSPEGLFYLMRVGRRAARLLANLPGSAAWERDMRDSRHTLPGAL